MWSTTSSTLRFVVSISSASSAGCMRTRSLSSRARRSVASASARELRALGQPPARAHGRVGLEVDLHRRIGDDHGADVAAFDHDVAVVGELALTLPHDRPDLGVPSDDGDEPVDLGAADRRRHVGAADEAASLGVEVDRVRRREIAEQRALVHRHAVAPREPGQRAVHGAGVEVAEAEALRQGARHGALARSRGTVDGNDHALSPPAKALSGRRSGTLGRRPESRWSEDDRHRGQ